MEEVIRRIQAIIINQPTCIVYSIYSIKSKTITMINAGTKNSTEAQEALKVSFEK